MSDPAGTEPQQGRWVRVFYYGLLPSGQEVPAVDPLEVSGWLAKPFGFSHLAHITATEPAGHPAGPEPGGPSDTAAAAAILRGSANGLALILGFGSLLAEAAAEWLENHQGDLRAGEAARSVCEMEEQALTMHAERIAAAAAEGAPGTGSAP